MVADQLQGAAAYGAAIENPAMPSTTIATSTPGASDLPTYLNHDEQATNHLPPLRHSFPTLPPPSASPMADMLEGSSRLAELAHASHHLPRLYASRQDSEPVAIRKSVEPSLGRADAMGSTRSPGRQARSLYLKPPYHSSSEQSPVHKYTVLGPNVGSLGESKSDRGCQDCSGCRNIVQEVVSSLLVLEMTVREVAGNAICPTTRLPEVVRSGPYGAGPYGALEWALEIIKWNVKALRCLSEQSAKPVTRPPVTTGWQRKRKAEDEEEDAGKRTRTPPQHWSDSEGASNAARHTVTTPHDNTPSRPTPSTRPSVTLLRSPPPGTSSVIYNRSEDRAYQPQRPDLQQQLDSKSRDMHALKQEHENALRRVERHKAKLLVLEKKYEISDAELAATMDEKERLQVQLSELEAQMLDLKRSKEAMRNEGTASGSQYMRMLEMANRLQAKGASDKKLWAKEKHELEARLAALRTEAESKETVGDAIVGTQIQKEIAEVHGVKIEKQNRVPPDTDKSATKLSTDGSAASDAELVRLRVRVRHLELLLASVKADSALVIQACSLVKERGARLNAHVQALDVSA